MNVFEFLELVDAHQAQQREDLRLRAVQACWIINSIPHFGKGKKRAVRPQDLVRLDGEELGEDGIWRTRTDRRHLTRQHFEEERQSLFEKFSRMKRAPYGRPRRFKSLDRR